MWSKFWRQGGYGGGKFERIYHLIPRHHGYRRSRSADEYLLKTNEFEYILNDCGARVLFASSSLAKELIALSELEILRKIIWIGQTPKKLQSASKDDYVSVDEEYGESAYLSSYATNFKRGYEQGL